MRLWKSSSPERRRNDSFVLKLLRGSQCVASLGLGGRSVASVRSVGRVHVVCVRCRVCARVGPGGGTA